MYKCIISVSVTFFFCCCLKWEIFYFTDKAETLPALPWQLRLTSFCHLSRVFFEWIFSFFLGFRLFFLIVKLASDNRYSMSQRLANDFVGLATVEIAYILFLAWLAFFYLIFCWLTWAASHCDALHVFLLQVYLLLIYIFCLFIVLPHFLYQPKGTFNRSPGWFGCSVGERVWKVARWWSSPGRRPEYQSGEIRNAMPVVG